MTSDKTTIAARLQAIRSGCALVFHKPMFVPQSDVDYVKKFIEMRRSS